MIMNVRREDVEITPARAEASNGGQHFRTDDLLGDLRSRALSGGLITVAAQVTKLGLGLISAVVLARLLTPEDFGLVAMVGSITGFLVIFQDAGLSMATIQKVEITHAQVSNLFWINMGVSATLSLLVAALSPLVAWFYRDPRLVAVTLALAGAFAVSGAVVQHRALLSRRMWFKAVALIDISSAVVGVLVGIAMACLKCGYWSLVGMQLTIPLAQLALTLRVSGWRPQRPTRGSGTWSLLQFGASLTVASVFRSFTSGMDSLLIGRWYGAVAVGLYNRAAVLLIRPVDQLTGPFAAVFIPILSRLQGDPARYRKVFLQAYGAVTLLCFTVTGLFMALSRPVVLVLLGPKWESVIPIFAWFTVGGLSLPLYCVVICLLNTQGRGKDILTTGLIVSAATVGSIVAGLPFGPVGVAASLSSVWLLVRLPVLYYIVGRRGPVRTADLWEAPLRSMPSWVVVFGATYFTRRLLSPNIAPILQLCFCTPVGLMAGVLVTLGAPSQRREVFRLWELVEPFVLRFLGGKAERQRE